MQGPLTFLSDEALTRAHVQSVVFGGCPGYGKRCALTLINDYSDRRGNANLRIEIALGRMHPDIAEALKYNLVRKYSLELGGNEIHVNQKFSQPILERIYNQYTMIYDSKSSTIFSIPLLFDYISDISHIKYQEKRLCIDFVSYYNVMHDLVGKIPNEFWVDKSQQYYPEIQEIKTQYWKHGRANFMDAQCFYDTYPSKNDHDFLCIDKIDNQPVQKGLHFIQTNAHYYYPQLTQHFPHTEVFKRLQYHYFFSQEKSIFEFEVPVELHSIFFCFTDDKNSQAEMISSTVLASLEISIDSTKAGSFNASQLLWWETHLICSKKTMTYNKSNTITEVVKYPLFCKDVWQTILTYWKVNPTMFQICRGTWKLRKTIFSFVSCVPGYYVIPMKMNQPLTERYFHNERTENDFSTIKKYKLVFKYKNNVNVSNVLCNLFIMKYSQFQFVLSL